MDCFMLRVSVHVFTSLSGAPLRKRFHESSQIAFGANGCKISLLLSVDVEIDVENVIMFLFVKSYFLTNVRMIFGACPHHNG